MPGLRAAIAFNAGNPVATTSSLMIGGPLPALRALLHPAVPVGEPGPEPFSGRHLPHHDAHAEHHARHEVPRRAGRGAGASTSNTNTNKEDDDHIRGYNFRGSLRVKLLDGIIVPFASAAYTRNDTLVATDLGKRAADRYQAVNLGGGVDIDVARRFKCAYDCADGFGLQYQQVQYQIGEGLVTTNRYANVGGTLWIAPNVSLGARFAYWTTKQEHSAETGERSVIAALRFIMN